MGDVHREEANAANGFAAAAEELKVSVLQTCLVFPRKETQKRSMFLSNIDQVLNFDVQTVHFFRANPAHPFPAVVEKLKDALARLLVPYDFLSGRVRASPDTGRLEIDCNAAGVGFVVASADRDLDDIGDLVFPKPAFHQLILNALPNHHNQHPLCIIQLTSFKCGGFAMGTQTNHAAFDGLSFKTFLENLAALAGEKPLVATPCNDRHLLAARSPPRVEFPHPELMELKMEVRPGQELSAPVFETAPAEELDIKVLRLSAADIARLKEKAKADSDKYPNARVTSFNAVTAHVWRCKAMSLTGVGEGDERVSTMLFAVDIRPRLRPPLPAAYAGNAVLSAYATAKCGELREAPLGRVVEMVSEGVARMTDEYARSVVDWGELHRGFPHGEFLLSSWWRLGFADVDYPWGRPVYSCPVVFHRKDILLLLPDIHDAAAVNVLAALPRPQMEIFHALFHRYLASDN